jgi:V/A-type H+-transporting ATPase subunit D
VRGHKLLKDKADEMVRQFMLIIKENRSLRLEVEKELVRALNRFMLARALTPLQAIEEALVMPSAEIGLKVSSKNVMSVMVPVLNLEISKKADLIPYSFNNITSDLDSSILSISELLFRLIKLAEIEKTCNMLADEIEKARRRVNALEHVLIPQLVETIKFIKMKLSEDERANIIRLMKVKSMIQNRDAQAVVLSDAAKKSKALLSSQPAAAEAKTKK